MSPGTRAPGRSEAAVCDALSGPAPCSEAPSGLRRCSLLGGRRSCVSPATPAAQGPHRAPAPGPAPAPPPAHSHPAETPPSASTWGRGGTARSLADPAPRKDSVPLPFGSFRGPQYLLPAPPFPGPHFQSQGDPPSGPSALGAQTLLEQRPGVWVQWEERRAWGSPPPQIRSP